jgi:hypothetical protein
MYCCHMVHAPGRGLKPAPPKGPWLGPMGPGPLPPPPDLTPSTPPHTHTHSPFMLLCHIPGKGLKPARPRGLCLGSLEPGLHGAVPSGPSTPHPSTPTQHSLMMLLYATLGLNPELALKGDATLAGCICPQVEHTTHVPGKGLKPPRGP